MKKIILGSLVASSLLMAEVAVDQVQLQEDIQAAKTEAEVAKSKLKKLQAQLPPNEALMTHTELGYIKTDGNTKTETLMLELDAKKGWENHSLTFSFDAQYAEDNGIKSKNKFETALEYGYSFTSKLSATYMIGYKEDKFNGFDYQAITGLGVKYLTIKTDTQELNLATSILYSVDKIDQINDATNNYNSYKAKVSYTWQVLSNLKFLQEASYRAELGETENYFVDSKTALTAKISDIFSAGASYKVDYINTPPNEKEYTDRTFTLNLIIDY